MSHRSTVLSPRTFSLIVILALAGLALHATPALATGASDFKLLCSSCHGDKGKGDGPVSAALDPKPANFTDPNFLSRLNDAYVKAVIKLGKTAAMEKSAGGYTPLAMPAFSNKLSDGQVSSLIAYVRAIQKGKPKPGAADMKVFNAKYAAAAALFSDNCSRCHGPYGEGNGPDIATTAKSPDAPAMPQPPDYRDDLFLNRFTDKTLTSIIKLGRVEAMKDAGLGIMPGMAAGLSDSGRAALIAHLRTLAPAPKPARPAPDSPPAVSPSIPLTPPPSSTSSSPGGTSTGSNSNPGTRDTTSGGPGNSVAPSVPPTPPAPPSSEGTTGGEAARADSVSIVRDPTDLPPPITRRTAATVRFDLEAVEVNGWLADGTSFSYWTFNGKVPGPFLRVRVGDTVEIHLKNQLNQMIHSIDLHAVSGPGGGAVYTQTPAGGESAFSFKALNPGLFVYHCASPIIANHISSGMFGLILVEPKAGLPHVDREFYMMQNEIYTAEPYGTKGHVHFDLDSMLAERPQYVVFNGAVGGLTTQHPLRAKVGETVRIYFGVAGPNLISSFHLIGGIWDRVYDQASLTSPPLTKVQTTLVPPGGATVVEYKLVVPGKLTLVDHALSRLEHGLVGFLIVDGPANPAVFKSLGPVAPPPPGDMH